MGIQTFKSVARQRARLVGEAQKLDRRISSDHARLAELVAQIRAFDEVLRAQGVDVDPDIYAPAVAPTPKKKYFAQGELVGLCLDALRTQRRPITTVGLLELVTHAKGVRWRSLDDINTVRRGIKNAMRMQVKRGRVIRVGTVGDAHDDQALWALPEHASVPWDGEFP